MNEEEKKFFAEHIDEAMEMLTNTLTKFLMKKKIQNEYQILFLRNLVTNFCGNIILKITDFSCLSNFKISAENCVDDLGRFFEKTIPIKIAQIIEQQKENSNVH